MEVYYIKYIVGNMYMNYNIYIIQYNIKLCISYRNKRYYLQKYSKCTKHAMHIFVGAGIFKIIYTGY